MDVHGRDGKPLHDGDPAHYFGVKAAALTKKEVWGDCPRCGGSDELLMEFNGKRICGFCVEDLMPPGLDSHVAAKEA
jgi:hypothetical protein